MKYPSKSSYMHGLLTLVIICALTFSTLYSQVVFRSTQMKPIEEAEKMRNVILKNFNENVNFIPEDTGPFLTILEAEQTAGDVKTGVIGALHGDFPGLSSKGVLSSVDGLYSRISNRGFVDVFVDLAKLGDSQQKYIPWMQATYIMAANKKALKYLPDGADINAITYEELKEWGKNMQEGEGKRLIGFPAGPKGLMHRFFQGYLYPSYTGGVVRTFNSRAAARMWNDFKEIWTYVNPSSTTYNFMQEPLQSEEIWVAFDHTARLLDAFKNRPNDFVAMPGPSAASGRGFMPVIVGLAIPENAPDQKAAEELIDYLTKPSVQQVTLAETGFYPVVNANINASRLPEGIKIAAKAISAQSGASDALPSLLPAGLGDKGGEFNKIYVDTFRVIVLRNGSISRTLRSQAAKLSRIMKETGAPCWSPDAPSVGPCPVE